MVTLITTVHVILAILIVIAVLLQSGKGGGLGAGFGGGGSNTLFGSSGGSDFFTKFTIGIAIVFAITSLSLTVAKSKEMKTSIFDTNTPVETQMPPSAAPIAPSQPPAEKAK